MAVETRRESPYRFLEPYEFEDRAIFYGRDRETKIFLADVLLTRLVVLFAPTGTGKTSLINAGVRPQLEDRGYRTYFVRVGRDPAASVRQALVGPRRRRKLRGDTLAEQLTNFAADVRSPIVLFFDQFEEFFLPEMKARRTVVRSFVDDVATCYRNAESGVHFVFSMRAEFFHEMDVFRDQIPTIFHSESNLRLTWFAEPQAREAISGAAGRLGVRISKGVEDAIVDDLLQDGEIEPAQLQIVCDTLWESAPDASSLTLRHYRALSDERDPGNIAEQVLIRRLERQLENLNTEAELALAAAILPHLRTRMNTKWVRELPTLAGLVGASEASIAALVRRLSDIKVVKIGKRDELTTVELTHDYLADGERLEQLTERIGTIWPRRVMTKAMADPGDLDAAEELGDVIGAAGRLPLSRAEREFVFRHALQSGIEVSEAFNAARAAGVDVMTILEDAVRGRLDVEGTSAAVYAVKLAAELSGRRTVRILRAALERPELALQVVETLGISGGEHALTLLKPTLLDPVLAPVARQALNSLRAGSAEEVSDRATRMLLDSLSAAADGGTLGPSDYQLLGRVEHPRSVEICAELASRDDERAPVARDALLHLTAASRRDVADKAAEALCPMLVRMVQTPDLAVKAVDLLGQVENVRAVRALVEVLALIRGDLRLSGAVELALGRLARSSWTGVKIAATNALEKSARPRPPIVPAAAPERRPASSDALRTHFRVVVRAARSARVIPFLGAGAGLADRPADVAWHPGANLLPTNFELTQYVAQSVEYPPDEPQDFFRVCDYAESIGGRGMLFDLLRRVFDVQATPTSAHRLTAAIAAAGARRASAQVLLTTNWDDVLEQALDAAGMPFDVFRYSTVGSSQGVYVHSSPGGGSPQVLEDPSQVVELAPVSVVKLHGSFVRDDPSQDSYLATTDDLIESIVYQTRSRLLPAPIEKAFASAHFLFLGHGLRDWSTRVTLWRISKDRALSTTSWAIMRDPSPIDVRLWASRDVDILAVPLDEYAREFSSALGEGLVESFA